MARCTINSRPRPPAPAAPRRSRTPKPSGAELLASHGKALADRIRVARNDIVWISAIAGAGKSMLLRELGAAGATVRGTHGPVLLDDPTPDALRHAIAAIEPRPTRKGPALVVASRPSGAVATLLLAERVYGRVAVFDDVDLFLTAVECGRIGPKSLHAETGGWPVLVIAATSGRELQTRTLLAEFLSREVLPGLPPTVAIAAFAALAAPLHRAAIDSLGLARERLHPLFGIDIDGEGIRIAAAWVRAALAEVQADAAAVPPAIQAGLIDFHVSRGDPTRAIVALNAIARTDSALAVFERSGGMFYGFRHGFDALERVLASFGQEAEGAHELLLGARVFELFKTGRAREALRRLEAHCPSLSIDLRDLQPPYRTYLLLLRIDIAVDLDESIHRDVVTSWSRLEALLPPDDHLARGILYNTMTIAFLRTDDTSQARQLAEEALAAYRRGHSPYLMHCMLVHLADVALRESRLSDASVHLRDARAELRRSGFTFNSEQTILDVFTAGLAYEEGRLTDCAGELGPMLAALVQGDSWPGLIRTIMGYAPFVAFWREGLRPALATAEQCVLALARRHGPSEDRGLALLRIRLLQIARRHSEAEGRIAELDLDPQPPASGHLAAEEGLIRLRAGLLQHAPMDSGHAAARALAELAPLERRHRITAGLLHAFLHYRLGDSRLSRRHLVVALRSALALNATGVLLEDAEILERLLPVLVRDPGAGNEAIGEFAVRLLALLRRLPASGLRSRAVAGVSRQEHRVLVYVADGCSNKEIARALVLSESAVKFHLRNLFRKLKVRRRAELLARVREHGLVP